MLKLLYYNITEEIILNLREAMLHFVFCPRLSLMLFYLSM